MQSLFWLGSFETQRSTVELRTGHAALAVPLTLHQYRNRFHHQLQLKLPMGIPLSIMQFNADGIGKKQVELGEFLERHKVKVAVIQESKLTLNSRTPNIQNFTTVRKDRHQGQGGGLLTLIHKSINFSLSVRYTRYSVRSSFGRVDYYSQAGKHRPDHYQRLHTPSKLLHRRIQSVSGSSDDDDGHPHIGRLQCSPLIVVFRFDRFERHYVGEHGVWLLLRYSQLGFTTKISGQCQSKFP